MTYKRHLASELKIFFHNRNQAIVLTGPRQAGKTTLLKSIFPKASYLNCDDEPARVLLNSHALSSYRQELPDGGVLILDEVQNLADPGRVGKLIVDSFPDLQLVITGSAGLTIKNKHTESMAGRAISFELLPLTLSEFLVQSETPGEIGLNWRLYENLVSEKTPESRGHLFDLQALWTRVLTYGFYPALIGDPNPQQYLKNLVDRVIFRDVFDLQLIDDKSRAKKLLTVLAYQIGQIVSLAELGNQIGLDQRTVGRYLKLFEESYLIYLLYPYGKRNRDELTRRPKVYFYDTGIRNALIGNFEPLDGRSDTGSLFENFVVMEAVKAIKYGSRSDKIHYWRTKQGSEVDLVFSQAKKLIGIELKWSSGRLSQAFKTRYPEAITKTFNRGNIY